MSISTQFLDVTAEGRPARKIAYLRAAGGRPGVPGLVWLPGFKSDMISTKASALACWADEDGAALLRFDYSGHGQSSGRIEDFTIGDWLTESLACFERLTEGPQILIGSSMGGWIALLIARKLVERQGDRLRAMVLIAPAWDMTEELMWQKFPAEAKAALERDGVFYRPSEYGEPYALTRTLIEEGRNHLIAGSRFDPGCPVRIIQGLRDPDVPWEHALKLVELLAGEDVRLTLVKDAEHRLSRNQDLALLRATIGEFIP